jgi:Ser/Thr protein kinase RdoA (MazF antagonist)
VSGGDLRGALIGRGGSSEVFAWGERAVLKLFRPEYQYAVRMEADRTRAVHAAGIPCPAVIDVVTLEGRQGIVFERVEGPTLLDDLQASPKDAATIGRRLAELHARVHTHTSPDLVPLVEFLRQGAADLPEDQRSDVLARLARIPEGQAVCHGDLHPGNVVRADEGPMILDWVNACTAHAAADIARSIVLMRFQRMQKGLPDRVRSAMRKVRDAVTDAYLEHYLSITGVTRRDVARCEPLMAAALLRHELHEDEEREQLERLARLDPLAD